MASNTPQQRPRHPPPAPPGRPGSAAPSVSTGSGGGGGGGIGRSAPLRSLPAGPPTGGGAPGAALPGGLGTPPLVKSKLALTPGRGAQPVGGAAAGGPPPARRQAPMMGPPAALPSNQSAGGAPSPPGAIDPISLSRGDSTDPVLSARPTLLDRGGSTDPVLSARYASPAVAASKGLDAPADELSPHIVSLPPPAATAHHPLHDGGGTGGGGAAGGSAGGDGSQPVYQPYSQPVPASQPSRQNHPLTQPYRLPPSQPPQITSPSQTAPPKQASPAKSPKKKPATPDEEVDAFLRGEDKEGDAAIAKRLRPEPLPTGQSILEKTKTLASRRAWGDVIRVTNDALLGKDVGMHHCCYGELLAAGGDGGMTADASTVAKGEELEKLRKETSELIALRFASQLKLRRYADLAQEVGELGLMPHLPDRDPTSSQTSGGGGGVHVRGLSGLPPSVVPPIGTPGTPATFATEATEASIDVLSSTPAATARDSSAEPPKPLAWKEGSMHSAEAEDLLPSWVPFGLRLVAATQLQYNDGPSKAIDVLYDLRDRAVRTEYWNATGMEAWRPAIDNALVNAFVRKREWRLALKGLEDLLEGLEDGVAREVDCWCSREVGAEERTKMKAIVTAAAKVELLSRQVLILLQSGAIAAAEAIQIEVRRFASEAQPPSLDPSVATLSRLTSESALVRQVPIRLATNEGLLLFARMKYTEAATCFRDALSRQRRLDPIVSSGMQSDPDGCPSWKDLTSPTLGFDADPSLTVECLNGLSLCLLYSGDMRSAVRELEGLIREDPRLYLTEGVAFNLCTLYELGSDGEECARRKRLLQRCAKRFYLHDVGAESFRLG